MRSGPPPAAAAAGGRFVRRGRVLVRGAVGVARLDRLQELREELLRHHHHGAVEVVGDVGELRVRGHRQVGGQGPRGRGPDDDPRLAVRELRIGQGRDQVEGDVDRGGGVVLVLHLGLGQRGPVGGAPVDRLLPAEQEPALGGAREGADDLGLVPARHGEVRRLPAPEDAQPLERLPLLVDPLLRVLAAGLDDLGPIHVALLRPELLVDLELDGQAVAVPAGDVVGHVPAHVAVLHHDVLQDLVERVADVDVAVGVGRPVVEDETRPVPPGVLGDEPLEDRLLLPLAQDLRLPLGQVRLHGKVGLGQVDGVFVVHVSFRLGKTRVLAAVAGAINEPLAARPGSRMRVAAPGSHR